MGSVGHIVGMIESTAEWLVYRFPRRHRSICIWLFEIGLLLPLPFVYLMWSGRMRDPDVPWKLRLASIAALAVGVIVLIFAVGMLQEMRRLAKALRSEKNLIWVREDADGSPKDAKTETPPKTPSIWNP